MIRGFDRVIRKTFYFKVAILFKCLYKAPSAHYCSAPALDVPEICCTESLNLVKAKCYCFFYYSG